MAEPPADANDGQREEQYTRGPVQVECRVLYRTRRQ